MIELPHHLYIGDADEEDLVSWLAENVSPVGFTSKSEFAYYQMYHGARDLWILDTTDVSDISSSKYDTITCVRFSKLEDCMMCWLVWGGSTK